MFKVEKLGLALLLALGAAFAFAQEAAPTDPAAPTEPAPEMAPAPELPDVAWVRFAHFSPNAPEVTLNLTPTDEETTFSGDGFEPLQYESFSEYVEVPTGNYVVSVQGVEGNIEEEFSFARGNYYTLAMMGLVLPAEVQAEQDSEEGEEQGGFLGFFQNLFGNGEADRDQLALQFTLFEDDLTRAPNEGETLVRLVHAAPGTQEADLAVMGEQGTLVDNVEFGNASRYAAFEGTMEQLEVRLSGSRAATLDLEGLNLQSGNLNTIYLVGTPVEEAPVTTLGSSIAPVQAGSPAGEDLAANVAGGEAAGGGEGDEDDATDETDGTDDGATEGEGDTGEAAGDDAGTEGGTEEGGDAAEGAAEEDAAGEEAGEDTEAQ